MARNVAVSMTISNALLKAAVFKKDFFLASNKLKSHNLMLTTGSNKKLYIQCYDFKATEQRKTLFKMHAYFGTLVVKLLKKMKADSSNFYRHI